ncbi:hypothetical protein GGI23_004409 [Coemansia sp. RSA 2559]|nr:hypothetical protein GGI23_004409 [Coemansia sp. RSA 2559]
MMAGPSNRRDTLGSSSSNIGRPGTNTYSNRTSSGSSVDRNGANDSLIEGVPSTANLARNTANNAMPGRGVSQGFDPIGIAQSLSSAYASAIAAGMAAQGYVSGSSSNVGVTAPAAPAKVSNAAGKSASHTPLGLDGDHGTMDHAMSKKMLDLRRTIRDIMSSVWADTECGRSAGMAGVTMTDDDFGQSDDYTRNGGGGDGSSSSSGQNASVINFSQPASNVALSGCGDRLLDDHLVSIFLDKVYHQLPIISRADFCRSYSNNTASPLLVCAMCSAASMFLNRIEEERTKIYDQYSQKVREKFHDACFEPSLEIVQTALIMTLCEYRHGSIHRAWVYLCKYQLYNAVRAKAKKVCRHPCMFHVK